MTTETQFLLLVTVSLTPVVAVVIVWWAYFRPTPDTEIDPRATQYAVRARCSNCFNLLTFWLPKGQLVAEVPQIQTCNRCGCLRLLAKNSKTEAPA